MARLNSQKRPTPQPRARFTPEYSVLLQILVELRLEAGLTQQQLAQRVGKSQAHVSLWERREREISVIDLWRWSEAVGCNASEVFATFEKRLKQASRKKRS